MRPTSELSSAAQWDCITIHNLSLRIVGSLHVSNIRALECGTMDFLMNHTHYNNFCLLGAGNFSGFFVFLGNGKVEATSFLIGSSIAMTPPAELERGGGREVVDLKPEWRECAEEKGIVPPCPKPGEEGDLIHPRPPSSLGGGGVGPMAAARGHRSHHTTYSCE
jgi:hypothetical protein